MNNAASAPEASPPWLDGGRRLLIDIGNTKAALLLLNGSREVARAVVPVTGFNEAAVREFLRPAPVRAPGAAYSVDAASHDELTAAIAAANALGAGRPDPAPAAPAVPDPAAPAPDPAAAGTAAVPLAAPRPAPVYVSSVVPALNDPLVAWLRECGWENVTFADPARREIMPHALATPETTGSDRLLAALAATSLFAINPRHEPVLVIQAGTALVLDLVDDRGIFRGGVIMPGPKMWLDSLGAAARLPRLEPAAVNWDAREPGADTASAILNGAAAGLVGAVKEAVRRLLMSLPKVVPLVVFTGGWGERLLPYFPGRYYPDLVLRGLDCLALRERPAAPAE